MEQRIRIVLRAQPVASDKGEWVIEGYAATAGLKRDGINIPLAVIRAAMSDQEWNDFPNVYIAPHDNDGDPDKLVGRVTAMRCDDVGLFVRVLISRAEPDVWTKINEGLLKAFSIGAALDLDRAADGTLVATAMRIRHIVITPSPVDVEATFEVARAVVDPATPATPTPRAGDGGERYAEAAAAVLGFVAMTCAAAAAVAVVEGNR